MYEPPALGSNSSVALMSTRSATLPQNGHGFNSSTVVLLFVADRRDEVTPSCDPPNYDYPVQPFAAMTARVISPPPRTTARTGPRAFVLYPYSQLLFTVGFCNSIPAIARAVDVARLNGRVIATRMALSTRALSPAHFSPSIRRLTSAARMRTTSPMSLVQSRPYSPIIT